MIFAIESYQRCSAGRKRLRDPSAPFDAPSVPPVDGFDASRPRHRAYAVPAPRNPSTAPHRDSHVSHSVRPAHGGGHERRFYRKVYAARSVSVARHAFRGGRPATPAELSKSSAHGMDGTHIKLDARMTSTPMVAQIIDCRRTSSREHRAPAAQREPRTPRTDDSHTTEILATYRPLPRPSGFCHAGQLPRATDRSPSRSGHSSSRLPSSVSV